MNDYIRVVRTVAPHRVAIGGSHRLSLENRKACVLLDSETFDEVRERALSAKTSWAAQARMLIEVGLETLKADGQ